MRYLALCCDYDGTLATEGRVLPETLAAVERLIAAGRRVVLVTGRELDELKTVCPRLELFEYVVAENGALLYQPSTGKETPLARRPPDSFIAALRARGVARISVGRVIVATWEPHETTVLETIKEQGLELQVIFNKGAVMILPAGVNKASGLAAALERMALSAHNAVGIGDAENDHALLGLCECGVAVANALPTLKEAADFVTTGERGAGVAELIGALLEDDLASHEPALARHHILLGSDSEDREVTVRPYGENLLLAGTAGSGKSALAAALLERLCERDYTFCVVDPEGGYESLAGAVSLGDSDRAPSADEILKLFRGPDQSGIVNLVSLLPAQRAAFFHALLPRLEHLRSRTGRPHWLVIDGAADEGAMTGAPSVLRITDHPNLIEPSALAEVNLLIVTGNSPQHMIEEFCEVTGTAAPRMDPVSLRPGEALAWRPQVRNSAPFRVRIKQL
jgi:hydroxymethylpyrimidine pyrophosphatase-like HAD family hydrolase